MHILSKSIIISALICASTQTSCMDQQHPVNNLKHMHECCTLINQQHFANDFNYMHQCCSLIDTYNQDYITMVTIGKNDPIIATKILNEQRQDLQNIMNNSQWNLLHEIKNTYCLSNDQWTMCFSIAEQLSHFKQNKYSPLSPVVWDKQIPQYFFRQLMENFKNNDINPALINLRVNNNAHSSVYKTMHPTINWTITETGIVGIHSVSSGYIEINSNFIDSISPEQQKILSHILTYRIKYPFSSILSIIERFCNIIITPENSQFLQTAHSTLLTTSLAMESLENAQLIKDFCKEYHTSHFSPFDYCMFSKIEIVQRYLHSLSS